MELSSAAVWALAGALYGFSARTPFAVILFYLLLVLSLILVKDIKAATERQAIAFNPDALIARLTHLPVLLLKTPKVDDVKGLLRDARGAMTRDIPLIMVTNALFFLGVRTRAQLVEYLRRTLADFRARGEIT